MATFNPFNPDGNWNWQNVSVDEEAAKTTRQAADAWAKAGKKAEEPWNQWQSQKSQEELSAFYQWKQAYVKFNDTTTKPGENWFRQEWDSKQHVLWRARLADPWFDGRSIEECLAYYAWMDDMKARREYATKAMWDISAKPVWEAHRDRPDAWKELLKQAERNRQQQKQERTWESYGGRNQGKNQYQQYKDFFNSGKRQRTTFSVEFARALILSNLDKFDVHYAEYWQRQRRMQMNEARSKIGQLSIVHAPSVAKQFLTKMEQSGGDTDRAGVNEILRRVFGNGSKEIPAEMDNYVKLLMSPLFKWNLTN